MKIRNNLRRKKSAETPTLTRGTWQGAHPKRESRKIIKMQMRGDRRGVMHRRLHGGC